MLGDGIVAGTAPGMAAADSFDGQPSAAYGAVFGYSLDGIL